MSTAGDSFTGAPPERRITALFDNADASALKRSGQAVWGRGSVAGVEVVVAATDPSVSRGAIGVTEANLLAQALRTACDAKMPLVLLLDSSGARVDEGLAALGAFRRLYREAVLARLGGVPMLALLGRSCFGGASMLACICGQRSYLQTTRLAASGPGVIQGVSGKDELDASDAGAVSALMGAQARMRMHAEDGMRNDSLEAAREVARAWVARAARCSGPDLLGEHAALRVRLEAHQSHSAQPLPDPLADRVLHLLPAGYAPNVEGRLFRALPAPASEKAAFVGAFGGEPIDAAACLQLAAWLLALPQSHARSPVVLILDAEGHAATVGDERVILSDYLAHLALTVGELVQRGHRIVLWITGAASGASYVAFSAGVDRVSALPSARVAVLPADAARSITGSRSLPSSSQAAFVATGVADAILDAHLERDAWAPGNQRYNADGP